MALQVTQEEYDRLQNHISAHARDSGGLGSKVSEDTKQVIISEYAGGNSIRRISIEQGVCKRTVRIVLRQAGLRS